MSHYSAILTAIVMTLAFSTTDATASVTEYTNKPAWISATGSHTTITFIGYPSFTNITTQYAGLGVTFTDGFDWIDFSQQFPNDGVGLHGAFDETTVEFVDPISAIAVDFPGIVQFTLFLNGQQVYQSTIFHPQIRGQFAGLVSDQPFDRVLLYGITGGLSFDDLRFGPPIPAPSAMALIALAALARHHRRRNP